MSEYTSGSERLHMAYTFDFLGGTFDSANFRSAIATAEKNAPNGWICLAFSNHDVVRHLSRWSTHGQQEEFARLAATMLLTMRGSVCLYQGEELGLTEAELAFEDLADPYGIEFWPQFKGRDGCRTPMVWQSASHLGGFTTAPRAWLPVPADHLIRAVDQQQKSNDSVLGFYRSMITFRKDHKALVNGGIELLDSPAGILAFVRSAADERILCVYNMTASPLIYALPAGMNLKNIGAPGVAIAPAEGSLSLAPFGAYIGGLG